MELFLWKGYKVYFYDEDNGTNYVEVLFEYLSDKDANEAAKIILYFFEPLEKGKGLPIEWTHGKNPKLKSLNKGKNNKDLWEYRDKSKEMKHLIRIYYGIDEKNRRIVFLSAHFKKDKKGQEREL